MSGIEIDFMTGAMLMSTLHAASALLFIWIAWRVIRKSTDFANDKIETLNLKWELIVSGIVIIANLFFAGAQPRLTIETLPNRELIEYQRNDDDIVIETPAPRTETLDGFQSLGE